VTALRIINLMGPEMTRLVEARFGKSVTVIELVPDSPVGKDLLGEVVLAPGRAAGLPDARWLLDVARCGAKWVHIAGANVGDVPVELFERGRIVTCSRGAMAAPISEFVLASMLALEKRFPHSWLSRPPAAGWGYRGELEADDAPSQVEMQPPPRWGYSDLGTLEGKVLGIFGFGSIGRATATKALAFGMTVLAVRRRHAGGGMEGVGMVATLPEMARLADHMLVAAPATPATEHVFNMQMFSQMKPGAHLVNVARGSLVNQEHLVEALDAGHLAFATLDVTQPEPLPAGHPLYRHAKVHLSPHISWCSPRKQQRTGEIVITNVESYLNGIPLHGVVDADERY